MTTVRELSVTPVKGTRLHHPQSLAVSSASVGEDRRFFVTARDGRLYDATIGALAAVKCQWDPSAETLAMVAPGGTVAEGRVVRGGRIDALVTWDRGRRIEGREVVGPWSSLLSDYLSKQVLLAEAVNAQRAVDVAPITILSDASVDHLALGMGVDALGSRRFRMTLTLAATRPFVEDEWYGRVLAVGSSLLRVTGPVPRCAAVTYDPITGRRDHPVLRAIIQRRAPITDAAGDVIKAPFGVYATVADSGTISVGDQVCVRQG